MHDHFIQTRSLRMHVVEAGPADGELVVLLHGFPEYWAGFERQIGALADAGYRVAVPDQRGYNLTERPGPVDQYRLERLGQDVIDLIDALGHSRAHLVGHDWGGNVAWWCATAHPDRLHTLTTLNMPHWAVMQRAIYGRLSQLKRSWYILFFQLPLLPELLLSANGSEALAKSLVMHSAAPISDARLAGYRRAWARPGAITAMLAWYRAVARHQPPRPASTRVTTPTLMLWGDDDPIFDPDLPDLSVQLCDDATLIRIPGASHFVQFDATDEVNHHLVRFLADHRQRTP